MGSSLEDVDVFRICFSDELLDNHCPRMDGLM